MSSIVSVTRSPSTAGLWRKTEVTVSASSTVEVDTIPLANLKNVKYFVSLENSSNNRYKSFELNALHLNSVISDTISNKLSSGVMSIITEMKVSGANAVLEITNNELFDLDVELLRGVLNG